MRLEHTILVGKTLELGGVEFEILSIGRLDEKNKCGIILKGEISKELFELLMEQYKEHDNG